MGHYQLTDRFTSRDGRMEPDPRLYGMTQHGLDVVGAARDQLGGATQVYVRIDGGPGSQARYFTRDNNLSFARSPKPESGWAVYDLGPSASYVPDRGEVGWWNATVDGVDSEVADDIGLPNKWHVSTFLVFTWVEGEMGGGDGGDGGDGGEGPDVPVPPGSGKTIFAVLYTDGTWVEG